MIPLQITFLDFPESDAVWLAVQKRVDKLERFFTGIVRCEVVISCPHRHRHADRLYHVQIHIAMPGEDIIISHDPEKNESHRDIYVAIRDSFRAAERQLQDKIKILRHYVKSHQPNANEGTNTNEGKVSKVFVDDGYGFLSTTDGREIYFGDRSFKKGNFADVKIGQRIRFFETPGEKGPLANSVTML